MILFKLMAPKSQPPAPSIQVKNFLTSSGKYCFFIAMFPIIFSLPYLMPSQPPLCPLKLSSGVNKAIDVGRLTWVLESLRKKWGKNDDGFW